MSDQVDDETRATIAERIKALHQKEVQSYYISKERFVRCVLDDVPGNDVTTILAWRRQMIRFCFQIVRYCDMSHESVIVAASYLDRFLFRMDKSRTSPRVGEARALALKRVDVFQLLTITCLYTAIKLNEPAVLDIDTLLSFTSRAYSAIQIEKMESVLLEALDWYLTPPTPLLFVTEVCQLANVLKIRDLRNDAAFFDLVSRQIDIVTTEPEWVRSTAYNVAYTCISNALQLMCISTPQRLEIENMMKNVVSLEVPSIDRLKRKRFVDKNHAATLQSIVVFNSRIEIREVISRETNIKYDEIDVVLQDVENVALLVKIENNVSTRKLGHPGIDCNGKQESLSESIIEEEVSLQDLQQRLLNQLWNAMQLKHTANTSSMKDSSLTTSLVSRLQSSQLNFVDYSYLC